MAFFGAAPFGSLLSGALAHRIGAPHTVIVTGAFCIAGSLWFTIELPKAKAVMRPTSPEIGMLLVPGNDLISDAQEPAILHFFPKNSTIGSRKENHNELV